MSTCDISHYGIIGAGGFGREVMPVLRAQLAGQADLQSVYFVVDSLPRDVCEVNGFKIITLEKFLSLEGNKFYCVAIGTSLDRARVDAQCEEAGAQSISIVDPTARTMDNVSLGSGSVLCGNTIITSNVIIGKSFHLNIFSYVAHDCIIGDYVTFAPNVHCNGNVHIGNHAYIGTGAIIKNGQRDRPLMIGERAIIGMGAVVTKSVPGGATVVGNPARVLER